MQASSEATTKKDAKTSAATKLIAGILSTYGDKDEIKKSISGDKRGGGGGGAWAGKRRKY